MEKYYALICRSPEGHYITMRRDGKIPVVDSKEDKGKLIDFFGGGLEGELLDVAPSVREEIIPREKLNPL